MNQFIKLGRTDIKTDYFAFTDAVAVLARDTATNQKPIKMFKETAERFKANSLF